MTRREKNEEKNNFTEFSAKENHTCTDNLI